MCTNIAMNDVDVLINTTGTPCIRCTINGQSLGSTAFYTGGSGGLVLINEDGTAVPGLAVSNGVLMIRNAAELIPDGAVGLSLNCQSGVSFRYAFELFSNSKPISYKSSYSVIYNTVVFLVQLLLHYSCY